MQNIKYILVAVLSFSAVLSQAQEREQDTLRTDVIDVVKPYTPSISDAFKVKEQPNLDDNEINTKKDIAYNIFSFPVASTFTPAKGKAATIDKAKKEQFYNSYATAAFGSNVTVIGELYLNKQIGRDQNFGAYLSHLSTQNGVSEALADTNFSTSKIDLNYVKRSRDITFQLNGGFEYKTNNWYGLQKQLFTETTANSLDLEQSYSNANISGDVVFKDAMIEKGDIIFRRFGDGFSSAENRFVANVNSKIEVLEQSINVGAYFDYVSGNFKRNYFTDNEINYGNIQVGIKPTYVYTEDGFVVNIGLKTVVFNDSEVGKTKFFIYPNVTASYNLVDGYVSLFGGLKGGLKQNSYYAFAEENPFVSPNLFIIPTDEQYKAFGGIRGKVTSTIAYEVSGSYGSSKAQALFLNNEITDTELPYTYGNSFGVVYDNMTTVSLGGRLDFTVTQDFNLGVKGAFYKYNTKTQEEAWNLPNIETSIFANYQMTDKVKAGTSIFYVGSRKDQVFKEGLVSPTEPATVTLGGYLDANVHVSYTINDRFSAFLKAQNLTNNQYRKWQNTAVQGFQVLLGANYKFDF